MGLKHLLLSLLAALPVEMSLQSTPASGAGVLQRDTPIQNDPLCGADFLTEVCFLCGDCGGKSRSLHVERNPQFPGSLHAVQMSSSEGLENVKVQSAPAHEINHLQDDHGLYPEPSLGNVIESYQRYKKHIVTAADDAGLKHIDPVEMTSRHGSSLPQERRPRRKRQKWLEMADNCCFMECTADGIRQAFCP